MAKKSPSYPCKVFNKLSIAVVIAVTTFVAAGCGESSSVNTGNTPVLAPGSDRALIFNGQPMQAASSDKPMNPETETAAINIAVLNINLPVGSVSRTERIWRYMDEQIGTEDQLSCFNSNGFRLATAPVSIWPKLSDVLRQMTGQSLRPVNYMALPGRPLELEMTSLRDPNRIFTFDAAGRLSGRDYPKGYYIFMMDFRINPDSPGGCLLHMAPQLRTESRQRIEQSEFGLRKISRPDYYNIGEMEITIDLPQDHFLVIGPGAAALRKTSAAAEFLRTSKKALGQEKILVIVPKVFTAKIGGESIE